MALAGGPHRCVTAPAGDCLGGPCRVLARFSANGAREISPEFARSNPRPTPDPILLAIASPHDPSETARVPHLADRGP